MRSLHAALSTQIESRQKDRRHHWHLTNGSCQARAPAAEALAPVRPGPLRQRPDTDTREKAHSGSGAHITLLSESQPSATISPLLLLAYCMPGTGHTDLI